MEEPKSDKCLSCGSSYIENRKHMLCSECNYLRMHGETRYSAVLRKAQVKLINPIKKKRKPVRTNPNKSKRQLTLEKDKETYKKVFEAKPNFCEECGTPLNDIFEIDGQILNIFQYSHILGKGSFPEFRHNSKNFNKLCGVHHDQWEFGERKIMNIYEKNQITIEQLFKEKNS